MAGCNPFPKTWQWNQKLTIEVETPQGTARGSAVTHVIWQEANPVGNYPSSYNGEATVVEVLPGRYLFALLGEGTRYVALRAFAKEIGGTSITPTGFAAVSRVRGTEEIPRKYYPLLVTFTDIADPKTVTKVDPDNLATSFGTGVAVKRITLEITDEKVTDGQMTKLLPWLEAVGRERATLVPNPPRLSTDLTNPEIQLLAPSAFSTELYR
ncbi:hypothetical protein [Mesorhizobium sp.]|uniref:hypothetical protein n=1 Tax=Mesorhizobium sp. TaxID=1871066 RepID=UPI000FE94DD3|nr:hypothetical protein [Mesorhizobium sp.]RWC64201.1 MAG: hypothetical protein EOS56_00375 [Mesorhizobium sp.]RWC67068.1 MAG: hypothetical protein EOS29_01210 [Mesorhizobium sp.]